MEEATPSLQGRKLAQGRLEALVEGVFAIAMTILVLDIKLPEGVSLSSADLWTRLAGQADVFLNYLMSFWLLALFWVIHNKHCRHLTHTTPGHIWLNMGMLAFVVLVPFTTSLFDVDQGGVTASALFALNLFAAGTFLFLAWIYACKQGLTGPDMDRSEQAKVARLSALIPLVSLGVLGLAFVIPSWCNLGYLVLPLFKRLMRGS